MRQKYVSRRKSRVAWRYFLDNVYGETRYYRGWVYTRADGSRFVCLDYPIEVKRDKKHAAYVERHAFTAR